MSGFSGIIQVLTTLLLHLPHLQVSKAVGTPHSKVMLFHEVWVRSLCRSLEKMVSVEHEYPGGVEHIFSPGCVPLQRCAGCCNDEKLECFPTLTRNITMQLVRISPAQRTRQYVQLSFLEHHSCECRPKRSHRRNQRQRIGSPRRRKKGKHGRRKEANFSKGPDHHR
ncbi:vascular endothelial growth factor A [Astyanax mexicanus]|uniref:Vascular endothelial growth factor A-like n=1 Tax=Astyanax mexicanus TaxID=7994 RepID=A0A3B1J0H2_ASTMX|nr:vascular endothelial growth factor A [Astyanax mexicanus]